MMQAFLRMTEDDTLVTHNREGIENVLSAGGKFAFFLESAGAEYATAQNCGLTTVGGNINTRNYGVVTQKDSAYRKVLNIALLEMTNPANPYGPYVNWTAYGLGWKLYSCT